MSRTTVLWAASVLCVALTACGGSVDGSTPTSPTPESNTEVPMSATASVAAFFQYLRVLVDDQNETNEPLGLTQVDSAPTSEVDDPTGLN
jgi:hypothetical protein